MSLAWKTVRRVASLARLHREEGGARRLQAVDTEGVEPLSGAGGTAMPMREDVVNDGGRAEAVLANAPDRAGEFFAVPKVVE